MNEITTRRIIAGSLFLLPIVLIKVTAFMSGGPAPAESNAAAVAVAVDPTALIIKKQSATQEQLSALKYMQWLEQQSYGDAPFHYEDRVSGPVRPQARVGELVLNAIMVTKGVETAVINGQLYRLNNRIGNTRWRVAEINNPKMQVTLKRSAGDGDITRVVSMRD